MNLQDFKDWLKTVIVTSSITAGKLDGSQPQTICVYNDTPAPFRLVVGGGTNGYDESNYKILVHWSNNSNTAEVKAKEIYAAVCNTKTTISGKTVWIKAKRAEPLSMGTDAEGIYEYIIEISLLIER